jgi:hypothetical protein
MVMDISKPTTGPIACPDGKVTGAPVSPFFGASEANRDLQFVAPEIDFNGGYYVAKTDKLLLSAEIVNYTNDTKQIYCQTEMEYLPGKTPGAIDIGLQVLEVDQCSTPPATAATTLTNMISSLSNAVTGKPVPQDHKPSMEGMIMPPKNQTKWSLQSKEMRLTQDGYILFRRGHMHDGGDAVLLKINNHTICESKATYGGGTFSKKGGEGTWDTISRMGECHEPIRVRKGDGVVVEARFDLGMHPA